MNEIVNRIQSKSLQIPRKSFLKWKHFVGNWDDDFGAFLHTGQCAKKVRCPLFEMSRLLYWDWRSEVSIYELEGDVITIQQFRFVKFRISTDRFVFWTDMFYLKWQARQCTIFQFFQMLPGKIGKSMILRKKYLSYGHAAEVNSSLF